ncbi:MAG: rhamnogalacturonan acetylesterase [Tepidisphaeraceae bacterium]|jgi:lysophospholipase L1-like esterase
MFSRPRILLMAILVSVFLPFAARADTTPLDLKFQFGSNASAAGYTTVASDAAYADSTGYGFEPVSAAVTAADHAATSDGAFYFSVKVPEGSYRVTVSLGNPTTETTTTVKAELRRLMLDEVHTTAGQFVTRDFNVNVRYPTFDGGKKVRLKAPRETTQEAWAWDDKLTLEFIGQHPSVSTIEITSANDLPVLYIIGDSTSTDQSRETYNSWGQTITRFFNDGIVVANHGESGETANSFIGENRWPKVLSVIKPGDWVFMQFGHNDEKDKGANAGAFKNYKTALEKFVADTRAHGATPVVFTPMHRKTFDANGKVTNSHGDYLAAARQVASEQKVALIDLANYSQTLYEAFGPDKVSVLFATPKEGTHHSDFGSYEMARCIVEGIKADNLSIAKYLVTDVPAFDPAHPDNFADFKIPADPTGAPASRPFGS